MTNGSTRQLLAKDKDGLTLLQRRTLQELAFTPDWREACVKVKVSPNTVKHWLTTEESFRLAYNNLLGPAVEITRDMLESAAIKAAGMYEEAVEAIKMVELEVHCPKCKHEFSVTNTRPDWNARLRAGDTLLKVSKILVERKEIEGTVTHLSLEERIALARWKHDGQIPPSMVERLRQKGEIHASTSVTVVDDS